MGRGKGSLFVPFSLFFSFLWTQTTAIPTKRRINSEERTPAMIFTYSVLVMKSTRDTQMLKKANFAGVFLYIDKPKQEKWL